MCAACVVCCVVHEVFFMCAACVVCCLVKFLSTSLELGCRTIGLMGLKHIHT